MISVFQNVRSRLQRNRVCFFIVGCCIFMVSPMIQRFHRKFQNSTPGTNIVLLNYDSAISSYGDLSDSEKKGLYVTTDISNEIMLSTIAEINSPNSHENALFTKGTIPGEIAMDASLQTSGTKPLKYKRTILIHGAWRGGSTFVSEFFNRHGRIAYIFEPLKTTTVDVDSHYIKGVLDSILQCRFHDTEGLIDVDKKWYHAQVFCQLPHQTPGCYKYGRRYISFEDAEKSCRSMPYKAYKFIRLPSIEILADYIQQGAKVIQLLRDPRGIYMSRFKIKGRKLNMKQYCDSRVADLFYAGKEYKLEHKQFMNNYYIIRYEDLALNPREEMYKLYEFLELQPDENVTRWASDQQKKSKVGRRLRNTDRSEEYTYGTTRSNPAFTAQSWRQTLSWIENKDIQNYCSEFLNIFGYRVFHNRTDLRKLDNYITKPMYTTNGLKT